MLEWKKELIVEQFNGNRFQCVQGVAYLMVIFNSHGCNLAKYTLTCCTNMKHPTPDRDAGNLVLYKLF
jgi:hypothetical protein